MKIGKCVLAWLLFAALVTGLCPIAAIVSSPLLAQSAPAESEKPTNEKPSSDEEKIIPEKTILGIVGGLAIFLFGVAQLARALKAVSGDRMKRLLARFTTNPFAGLVTGTVATTALDSSSVVIIMTIAMVHAGVLTFSQALGIVLGANIGTTIGGQIIAFDVAKFAPAFLLGGLLVHFFGSGDRWKNWGLAVIGAGLIFFGLDHIGSAMEPFKNYAPFIETMKQVSSNPFFGVLLGAGFTVAIQSSSGTMGIVIILASEGLIPLPAAVHLILGAEVGTCADTLLASIGRSADAFRTAIFHLLFNLITVSIGLIFANQLVAAGQWLAFGSDNVGRQIANAHVLFNVAGALAFVGLVPLCAKILERLIPDRRSRGETLAQGQAAH